MRVSGRPIGRFAPERIPTPGTNPIGRALLGWADTIEQQIAVATNLRWEDEERGRVEEVPVVPDLP